jgi:TetR/AcrR family transcriptional regulator, lmrAB and yxaGH operons repressor
MSGMREQIILTMCDLLEAQGYHSSGLNQLVKESGAPKGSLYHYFPDGKEGLAAEAIAHSGRYLNERIRQGLMAEASPAKAVQRFVERIADLVESSGFRAGGPLTTVAMETATTNERLNRCCQAAFAQIEAAFAEKLVAGGIAAGRAAELATFITSAIEGGTLLSRTRHSGDPLRLVARELGRMLALEERATL